jgi:ABC-type taurine transport system substrate-binding protein
VNELEKDGTVLTDSEKVGQWGAPTLDVWVVRKDFAEKHPDVVKAFAKSAIDAQQPYISNPDEWLKQPANLEKLAPERCTGSGRAGAGEGNTYLTPCAAGSAADRAGEQSDCRYRYLPERAGQSACGRGGLQPVRDRSLREIRRLRC